jgi:hypothetical protein
VKFYSCHAEMIADQTNRKTYTNRSNSAALAGHAGDVVFDENLHFCHIGWIPLSDASGHGGPQRYNPSDKTIIALRSIPSATGRASP